jgi:AcrR family transcriptional regulator
VLIEQTTTNVEVDKAPLRRGERRKQHTKRRLLDAAAETYAELGVEGATISAITERADVGLGTFYLHFEDKDTIAAAVSSLVMRRILVEEMTALEAVRSVGGDPDPLAIFARVVCGRAADTPKLMCALLRWEGPRDPVIGEHEDFAALRQSVMPHLTERFGNGMNRGLYRTEDPSLAANALLGVMATCIISWVQESRADWNTLASFVERSMVGMFRR